ncbi:hypothetical protein EC528_07655 [Helicobacter pylori]|uniref:Lipoprotein n=1 Tax=Helicobacter pylori TaxID=210 RepID=A0AAW8XGW9_HELPX|nr:hypothetical protein [Helicobacter pylori]MDU9790703.1 hypothetical protein [Helicobacter pylori]PUD02399.1 hypothetical protein C2R91_05385 [Helicobacter pylori]RVZ13210.1 hypothetical protein EC528_07655 [Helicobacter pylori]WQW93526.1 hypothetical protein FE360_07080 [Helicobacter pylori]WQY52446.1 hypothetical protein KVK68_07510 [Helicobacter pylori]
MLFKTYQKLLGASCLALYLVGCGSGGESPIEMSANSEGVFQIDSRADSVTIQGVKLNRGNCVVNLIPAAQIGPLSQIDGLSSLILLSQITQLGQKGVMKEPKTLKFGEKIEGFSRGCNIIEAEIQTDKGSWTFNFNR